MPNLLPLLSAEKIAERLTLIFPPGIQNRNYLIRQMAANTIYVMLYIGAVEGEDVYFGPQHAYRMTNEQSGKTTDEERIQYNKDIVGKNKREIHGKRWYADNSREPLRDETLRDGLIQVGAVIVKEGVPQTSGKPRYALKSDLAALFNPSLEDTALEKAISDWQKRNLSVSALARVQINLRGGKTKGMVLVTFPNGETRHLSAGPSSVLTKHVIENFSQLYLKDPFVLWLSESGNKVSVRDDELASRLGINIDAGKVLPDIILVEMGTDDPLLVFVEVVATDGAITDRRKEEIHTITDAAKFKREHVVFVTAYMDRQSVGFKKTVTQLAWNSFAWFASESDKLFVLREGATPLSEILKL
jgi:hypothetical protein